MGGVHKIQILIRGLLKEFLYFSYRFLYRFLLDTLRKRRGGKAAASFRKRRGFKLVKINLFNIYIYIYLVADENGGGVFFTFSTLLYF